MNNPQKILRTLDAHLVKPTRIVLFGRAALALGYDPPEEKFGITLDVDAILPGGRTTCRRGFTPRFRAPASPIFAG